MQLKMLIKLSASLAKLRSVLPKVPWYWLVLLAILGTLFGIPVHEIAGPFLVQHPF
jgi:hypothetical protein